MCGRLVGGQMTQAQMAAILNQFLSGLTVDTQAPPHRGGWNVKPTNQVQMVCMQDGTPLLTTARWWFVPHWHKGPVEDFKLTTFNAKIETADQKPVFRQAWARGRCAIPALGYYEWTGPKKARVPNYITAETNAPVLFLAGLQSTLENGLRTCTILTRPPCKQIAHIHNRMPVILPEPELEAWISGDMPTDAAQDSLGTSWDGRFRFHEVASIGRDADGPELIEPIERLL